MICQPRRHVSAMAFLESMNRNRKVRVNAVTLWSRVLNCRKRCEAKQLHPSLLPDCGCCCCPHPLPWWAVPSNHEPREVLHSRSCFCDSNGNITSEDTKMADIQNSCFCVSACNHFLEVPVSSEWASCDTKWQMALWILHWLCLQGCTSSAGRLSIYTTEIGEFYTFALFWKSQLSDIYRHSKHWSQEICFWNMMHEIL